MSKRQSKVNKLNNSIEALIVEIQSTVTRNHEGEVIAFSDKAYKTFDKCMDEIQLLLSKQDFLTEEEKNHIESVVNTVQNHLPYLDGVDFGNGKALPDMKKKAKEIFARLGFSDIIVPLEDSEKTFSSTETYLIGYEDENGDECEEDGTYL